MGETYGGNLWGKPPPTRAIEILVLPL